MNAMEYATTGTNNTAIGNKAMLGTSANPMTGAGGNVAIGDSALLSINGAAAGSTAIGYDALNQATGSNNTAVGYNAGEYVTSATGSVAIGMNAMTSSGASPLTGIDNTAVGHFALYTTQGAATDNTGVGRAALYSNATGSSSTAVGTSALYSTTGSPNVAVGYEAGTYISSGTHNTAIGTLAMLSSNATQLSGGYNVAVGDSALSSIQGTGANNVAIGYAAGYSGAALTTGTGNVFIGYTADASTATDTNEIVIGGSTTGEGSNTILLGNSSITAIYAHVTTITSSSDRRLKKDIEDTDLGLDFIGKLRPISFRYNNGDDTLRYGFIAQDVEQALPKTLRDLV